MNASTIGPRTRRADVDTRLTELAGSFGYSLGPDPEAREERAGTAWWFYRRGQNFVSEALAFRVEWIPKPELETHFFGSMLQPDDLELRGVSGNAAGFNLFVYQVTHLNRAVSDVLPQSVDIGAKAMLDDVLAQLEAEIARVDASIWDALWRAYLKHQQRMSPSAK